MSTQRLLFVTSLVLLMLAWGLALLFPRNDLGIMGLYLGMLAFAGYLALYIRLYYHQLIYFSGLTLLMLLFAGYLFLTLAWGKVPSMNSYGVWLFEIWPVIFLTLILWQPTNAQWRRIFAVCLAVVVFEALMAIFQYHFLSDRIEPRGTFTNQNDLASLLNLALLPLIAWWLAGEKSSSALSTWIAAIAAIILFYAECLIASRGALFSFIVMLFALLICLYSVLSWKKIRQLFLVLVLIFCLGYPPLLNLIFHGHFSMVSVGHLNPALSAHYHVLLWKSSWAMLQHDPYWGIGPGSFTLMFQSMRYPNEFSSGYFVHNDYLQMWIEAGIVGIGLLVAIVVCVFFYTWKLRPRKQSVDSFIALAIGMGAGAGTMFIAALVSFPLNVPEDLMALAIVMAYLSQQYSMMHSVKKISLCIIGRVRFWLFYLLSAFLLLLIVVYFSAMSFSYYFATEGIAALSLNKNNEALRDAKILQIIQPHYESGYMIASVAIFQQLTADQPMTLSERLNLSIELQELLEQARKTNPYDPAPLLLQAQYLLHQVTVADLQKQPEKREAILALYKEALALDPRNSVTRIDYATYLMQIGEATMAANLMKEGLMFVANTPSTLIAYSQAYAMVLDAVGNKALAKRYRDYVSVLNGKS